MPCLHEHLRTSGECENMSMQHDSAEYECFQHGESTKCEAMRLFFTNRIPTSQAGANAMPGINNEEYI